MKIVVVGSVNLDLSARVATLPKPGETVTDAQISRFPGGKGANQALAAKKLGADVQLVACVGRDDEANQALALLKEFGVDLSQCIVCDDVPTGIALISVSDDGENSIVVAPGANRSLLLDTFDLPGGDALICQLEVPGGTVASAVAAFDGFVCVNLAPARDIPDAVIENADLVVVNEVENDWYGEKLASFNGLLAITYGKNGAELWRKGTRVAKQASPTIQVADTTGAGDTFTAALTVALIEGKNEDDALRFACCAGALAATKSGAQTSLPARKDVDEMV